METPELGSSVSCYTVVGQDGNFLGSIEGMILDTANRQVDYLVFRNDDLLGDSDILISWSAFYFVTYDVGVAGAGDLGAIDEADALADDQLLGTTAYDAGDAELGTVEEVIEDDNQRYAVLNYDNRFVPVPVNAFRMDGNRLVFDNDAAVLDDAPGYRTLNRVNPSAGAFDGVTGYWRDYGLLDGGAAGVNDRGMLGESQRYAPGAVPAYAADDYRVPENRALMLNLSETELQDAPEFDAGIFDDAELAEEWDTEEEAYWGGILNDYEPEPSANALAGLLHIEFGVFDGIDFDVENPEGNQLGEVENFIITPDGSVPFMIVETDSFLELGAHSVY